MGNNKLSVIIPSKKEFYLQHTIDDLLKNAAEEIEIIAILDDYWPEPPLEYRKNVIWLHKKDRLGLRRAINESMRITSGKYIMKVDAHCMFDEGFDVKLKSSCEDNWIMVPRRKSLDAPTWTVNKKTPIDYEFIGYPFKDMDASVKVGNVWHDRTKKRINIPIDDLMTFQGSCWFIPKKYLEYLGPFEPSYWGSFVLESEELGNKAWLSGGKVMVNKNTWYAHWHKGKDNGRGYFLDTRDLKRGRKFHTDFFMNNRWLPQWPKQVHDYEWLIDHFWPIPDWPNNWKEVSYKKEGGLGWRPTI